MNHPPTGSCFVPWSSHSGVSLAGSGHAAVEQFPHASCSHVSTVDQPAHFHGPILSDCNAAFGCNHGLGVSQQSISVDPKADNTSKQSQLFPDHNRTRHAEAQPVAVKPTTRKRKAPTLRNGDWARVKVRVVELYTDENRTLDEVKSSVEQEFGFTATIRQYKHRLSQWGQDKQVKPNEMKAIVRKQQHRKLVETSKRESVPVLRGRVVKAKKIARWMNDNKVSEDAIYAPSPTAGTPDALSMRTISERGSPAPSPADLGGGWEMAPSTFGEEDGTPTKPEVLEISFTLPWWASAELLQHRKLPWFQFRSWLSSFDHAHPKPQIQDASSTQGSPIRPSKGVDLPNRPDDMEIAIMLRRLHGGGFKLEEVMPACFRSSGSATQGAPSGNSIIVQLAEIGFFSVSNNLMHESNIVELLRKSLDADGGRLFKALFKVKSPTVQSFICRLLEGLSSGPSWSYGSSLLRQLESCGLDRNILAGPTGGRCLQLAIWHFNTDIALYLIREGFQIHPKLGPSEPFNQTPVQLATLRHNRVVLDALLGRPSDRIEPQPAQKSHTLERNKAEVALQEAIYENDLEEIKCLLLDGLDVDSAHTDWGDRILDFAFFENRMAYDLMLLHSRALDHLCTVPGIISAANTRERLEAYLDDRIGESNNEIEDHHEDGYEVLQRAVKLAIAFDRMREAKTILDLDWVREGLDLEMLLLEAAQYWRFDIMVELVAWGADVTALNEVRDDQEELLDFALGDADSVKNSYGWITPLQEAIKWASLEVVEFLIDAGALTTHIPPDCSCRALGTAVKQGDAEIVQLLIQRGADVKEFADKRETGLLEFAIESEYCGLDVLNILLEAGASIDGSTGWNTPLTRAILRRRGHEIIYLLLERGADIDRIGVGKWARTPLQAAAQMGDVELTKELLRRGAPVNTGPADDHGRTALQAACEGGRGNEAVILLLLQAGADISAPPALSYGRTALQALCCSENPSSELVALLSDREPGAIYAQPASCGGLTALQGAALMGNMKIVILLIEKLADVNEPPSQQEGRMALDGAAEYGRIDIVQLLLTFGATCMAPGSGYNSAVTFATNNGHFAIADMLKGHSQQSGLAPDRSNAGS